LFATGPRAVTWASWALNLDPAHQSHLTLAAAPPPPSPWDFCSRPLPLPFLLDTTPLSHLLPPQTFAALTTQNPSRPPPPISLPPPSKVQPSLVVLRRVAAISIGVWREEEGRRKGRIQGEFMFNFFCFCAAINWIMRLSLRIGRVAVQEFCEWVDSSSSRDFWEFSWVKLVGISGIIM
jgi:hypothetical protein